VFAALFVLLYVAHHASDYPFQTDHQAQHKAEKSAHGWRANLMHAGTHVLASAVVLTAGAVLLPDVDLALVPALVALVWIGATHAVIDRRWPIQWDPGELHQMREEHAPNPLVLREV